MNHVPYLDYMGATGKTASTDIPLYYLAAAFLLFALAVLGRWRQVQT